MFVRLVSMANAMNSLYKLSALFIIIPLFFYPVLSIAKETDLKPLTIFFSDDPDALGMGGLVEEDIFYPDIYRPVTMLGQKGRISLQYHEENVLNVKDGDRSETSISSVSKELSALLPLELPIFKKSAVAISSRSFEFTADSHDINQDMTLNSSQDYGAQTVSFSSAPFSFIRVGIGWESHSDRSSHFYEAALTPVDGLSVNYRAFNREMDIENSLLKDGHLAAFLFNPSEDVREISINADLPDILQSRIALEDGRPGNGEFYLKAFIFPSMTVNYQMQKRGIDFLNDIIIDGIPNGHASASIDYSSKAIEIDIHPSSTRYFIGMKESSFDITGAGLVSGSSILGFWDNLLAGERFFNYNLKVHSTQYHAGIEGKAGERLTLRGGVQYIITRPDGKIDHWTPYPFIKIGRLDEEIINLEYTKATFAALNLGLSYRINKLEVAYGFGQIIPIDTEKRGTATSETGTGAGRGDLDIGEIWEKIKENPGGNMQSLKVSLHF